MYSNTARIWPFGLGIPGKGEIMRQYIGARYVPIIEGEWINTKIYEPLTVVSYMGSSYISKKEVPAGTSPLDKNFWMLSFSGSTQITTLQNQVNSIVSEIENMGFTVEELVKKQTVSGMKVLFIGDSYTQGSSPDGTLTSYATQCRTVLETLGAKCDIKASGGAGWVNIGQANQTYFTMLNSVPDSDALSYTDVWIVGGANDSAKTSNEIVAAINTYLPGLMVKFKNAKFHYAHVACNNGKEEYLAHVNNTLKSVLKANSTMDIKHNSKYVLHDNSFLSSDGLHPNQNGQNALASYMIRALFGSDTVYYEKTSLFHQILKDGVISLNFVQNPSYPRENTGAEWFDISNIPDLIIPSTPGVTTAWDFMLYAAKTEGGSREYMNIRFLVRFNLESKKAQGRLMVGSGGGFQNYYNISNLYSLTNNVVTLSADIF